MKPTNRYRWEYRDFRFVLFEQFKLGELLGKPPYEAWGEEEVLEIVKASGRFAQEVLGPLNAVGDREGCSFEGGRGKVPVEFRQAWTSLYETGFKTLGIPAKHDGQGAPRCLQAVVEEILAGANSSFSMYPALTAGAAEVVAIFGTGDQQKRYLAPMYTGRWAGTMCLTEADAGSDVGASRTKAVRLADGTYRIQGSKLFISGGDQDITENVVHLVLARVEGAPLGTKGLSMFVVPKIRVEPGGGLGKANDVLTTRIEGKLGLHGSATCELSFGENGGCVGELVGAVEGVGMSQMFKLMNFARLLVGLQGLGIASSAWLNALDYAKERKQGADFRRYKDASAPRVAIVEHADVRRMLLDMKARVEGIRAMIVKLAVHHDRALSVAGSDDEKARYHNGQVELLTPLVKAYASDQAFQICATAIQVMGGAGYTSDHPIEQYLRDSKVFSIYEGTNHIQAMDLVGRKLGQSGGAHLMEYLGDLGAFVEQHREHPVLAAAVKTLGEAQEAVAATAMGFMGWSQDPAKLELIPSVANRFLEMMSEATVGWLLLDQAVIALDAQAKLSPDHPDRAFYEGKKFAALHFARNALADVPAKARMIAAEDRSAMEIPLEALATS